MSWCWCWWSFVTERVLFCLISFLSKVHCSLQSKTLIVSQTQLNQHKPPCLVVYVWDPPNVTKIDFTFIQIRREGGNSEYDFNGNLCLSVAWKLSQTWTDRKDAKSGRCSKYIYSVLSNVSTILTQNTCLSLSCKTCFCCNATLFTKLSTIMLPHDVGVLMQFQWAMFV